MKWKIEDDVDHFVQGELEKLGLRRQRFWLKNQHVCLYEVCFGWGSKTAKKLA